MEYKFPVTNEFDAREVLELDFEVAPMDEKLYVNFDEVRKREYLDMILYSLNVKDDRLQRPTRDVVKILFSGHRGCGKSMELKRLHSIMDHKDRYFSVFISMEQEMDVGKFQPEDLFLLLLSGLAAKLEENGISQLSGFLEALTGKWMEKTEIRNEVVSILGASGGGEAEVGTSFLNLFKLKSFFKAFYQRESRASQLVRQEVRQNSLPLIHEFNRHLDNVRLALKEKNLGQDILFILDGTEKIPWKAYEDLFIKDVHLVRSILANCIFSIPISAYYDIQRNPSSGFFHFHILPMIKIDDKSAPLMEQVVTRRIDRKRFLASDALNYCVEMSGGCIRQLLRIVHMALLIQKGALIDSDAAKKSASEIGRKMWEQLETKHISTLQSGKFQSSDEEVLDLLFSLVLLKYNGDRKINPLIADLVPSAEPCPQ